MSKKTTKKQRLTSLVPGRIGIVVIILVLVIAAGAGGFFYIRSQSSQKTIAADMSDANAEAIRLIEEVGKYYLLPTGETPTIATVSDKTKLAGQAFFALAENGDKVLIYSDAKKAVLYRPSIQKIVEVGPVNIAAEQNSSSSAEVAGEQASLEPAKVVLYNGTTTNGLTRRAESKISSTEDVEVIERLNALKSDYEETIVVDLSGNRSEQAKSLADTFEGTVGSLPEGEDKPSDADILVILGQDFADQ